MDRWLRMRGWRQLNEGMAKRERETERKRDHREGETVFFRQDSLGRSIGGASHTRHLCGNKRGREGGGEEKDHPRRVERAPFLSRAPRPRATTTPQPDLSVNRPGSTIECGNEPTPFNSNTRTNSGFFFFPIDFFLFRSSRGAKSKFAYAKSTRIARRGRATRPLIKNFSDRPLVLIIATVRCACR